MKLGIDFGTTRTVVAAAAGGRHPLATFDVGGAYQEWLPGYVARVGGVLRYGWEAREALLGGAGAAVRSLKRALGGLAPDAPVEELGAPAVSALEVLTGYLGHLRAMICEHSNLDLDAAGAGAPLAATVAVPANASSRQRYLTLEAFGRAGFRVDALLNEPTAAAIEFAHRNRAVLADKSPKSYVVVYDLGGGTFDTSAVSLRGRGFELLATEGIARLGGDDFDEALLDLVLARAGVARDALEPPRVAALLDLCREAKETLRATTRQLHVEPGAHLPGVESIAVDTAELYDRCAPLVERTLALVDRLFVRLPEHGIDPANPRELGGLYLVGGAAAFPAVARALRAVHKRKIALAPQPHAATAVGLAVAADPDAAVLVREAVTRHFGVWREAESGREPVFDAIISKDTAPGDVPLVVERAYRPRHTVGHLRYLECTAIGARGEPAGDLTPWRAVHFPYDPALAGGDEGALANAAAERTLGLAGEEIVETYTYGRDGSIRVRIANRTSGYAREYRLDGAS